MAMHQHQGPPNAIPMNHMNGQPPPTSGPTMSMPPSTGPGQLPPSSVYPPNSSNIQPQQSQVYGGQQSHHSQFSPGSLPAQMQGGVPPNVIIGRTPPPHNPGYEAPMQPYPSQYNFPQGQHGVPPPAPPQNVHVPPQGATFVKSQLDQLRAQISAYKLLSKSQPLPETILLASEGRAVPGSYPQAPCAPSMQRPQPPPTSANATQAATGPSPSALAAMQYGFQHGRPSFASMAGRRVGALPVGYQGYPGPAPNAAFLAANAPTTGRSRVGPLQRPQGLDPVELLKEREQRIQSRVGQRVKDLSGLSLFSNPEQRVSLQIELRSLRLLNFQRQLRQDIVSAMRRDTSLETALNIKAYRRPKKQSLREARFTEKLERQMKHEQDKRRRQKHQEFLNAVLSHGRDFREYHRNVSNRLSKINKAVMTAERDRRREQQRIDRERMRRLMEEDDDGYRHMIDEKKNKRLHYLLTQTDEFIDNLTNLVKDHKREQEKIRMSEVSERRRELQDKCIQNACNKYHALAANMLAEGLPTPNFVATLPMHNMYPDELRQASRDFAMGKSAMLTNIPWPEVRIPVCNTSTKEIIEGEMSPLARETYMWLQEHPGWLRHVV